MERGIEIGEIGSQQQPTTNQAWSSIFVPYGTALLCTVAEIQVQDYDMRVCKCNLYKAIVISAAVKGKSF